MSADREHELKVWPPFYAALADGSKTFEVRKDDRGIQSGNLLRLREWQPFEGGAVFSVKVGDYTGRETTARVGYVLRDEDAHEFGVQPGYCVLALLPAQPARPAENLGSAHPAPHPQGGTLRERIEALCDEADADAQLVPEDQPHTTSLVRSADLRALLAAAPAPTE